MLSCCATAGARTARRRGVALALATPTSAKTNRVVRIGNGTSSEFGKSGDTNNVVLPSLLIANARYYK